MPDPVTTDAGAPAIVKPTFAPGTVVAGRYRLESRLGAGGGGTVWRCFDTQLSTTVAFKIVAEDVDVERWRREVAMARRIADKNVCRVHDLGETPECRYVTMELVAGTSLRSKCHVDLPADEARALFRQVVSGAAAIHAAGIVHRDLKPENIVVEPSGRAVIVDFGLAKEPRSTADTMDLRAPAQTVTNTGMIVGTPRYMSPEQAVGDTVDARADVWALGLIGHELLTGAFPGMEEDGSRHVGELPKWPRAAPIVRRCLSLLPKDRFADAPALLVALAEPKRGGARIAIAVVAAVVATFAVIGVRALIRKDKQVVATMPVTTPIARPAKFAITQLTNTLDKNWPQNAPMSVAISPDGKQFAYTTPTTKSLLVRSLVDATVKEWELPYEERPSTIPGKTAFHKRQLMTAQVVGWHSDGTLAVLGQTEDLEWRLYRVTEKTTPGLLIHSEEQRFAVAITPDDIAVMAKNDAIVDARTEQRITSLGGAKDIVALAVSPDGKRIASIGAAASPDEVAIRVHSLADEKTIEIWHGVATNPLGELLVWLDADRVAFGATPPLGPTELFTHDLRTHQTVRRIEIGDDFIAAGSIAGGTLLLLRGTAPLSVQVSEEKTVRQSYPSASALAGWIDEHTVVLAQDDSGKQRIVRASLADGKVEPWPNTTPGVEVPDAVAANSIFTHRTDGEQIVVERVASDGTHTELARLPKMPVTTFVRCADETTEPCVLEQVSGDQVTWTKLDLAANKLDKVMGSRPRRSMFERGAAISNAAKRLVVVEGTTNLFSFPFDGPSSTLELTGEPHAIAAARDGSLWVSTTHDKGWLFGFGSLEWSRERHSKFISGGHLDFRQLRWSMRPAPSPDGKHVAVLVRELHVDLARVDGL